MLENLTTQHFLEGRKESGSIWIHFGKIGKYFHVINEKNVDIKSFAHDVILE
jgi:hypothetical protein